MPLKKIPAIIIEDSEVDLWLITFMLKKIGDVEILNSAKTGSAGVKLIEKHKPDLIFLDLDLPEVSGIEIARMIRDRNIRSNIVFVTSFEQYAGEVQEFEPFDYLVKPLTLEILTDVLRRYKARKVD
ncbi:MAG: response regulator [Prolixibacteraceae bacterium]|nr:response regulator [Prolixibacteraceae bacterium]